MSSYICGQSDGASTIIDSGGAEARTDTFEGIGTVVDNGAAVGSGTDVDTAVVRGTDGNGAAVGSGTDVDTVVVSGTVVNANGTIKYEKCSSMLGNFKKNISDPVLELGDYSILQKKAKELYNDPKYELHVYEWKNFERQFKNFKNYHKSKRNNATPARTNSRPSMGSKAHSEPVLSSQTLPLPLPDKETLWLQLELKKAEKEVLEQQTELAQQTTLQQTLESVEGTEANYGKEMEADREALISGHNTFLDKAEKISGNRSDVVSGIVKAKMEIATLSCKKKNRHDQHRLGPDHHAQSMRNLTYYGSSSSPSQSPPVPVVDFQRSDDDDLSTLAADTEGGTTFHTSNNSLGGTTFHTPNEYMMDENPPVASNDDKASRSATLPVPPSASKKKNIGEHLTKETFVNFTPFVRINIHNADLVRAFCESVKCGDCVVDHRIFDFQYSRLDEEDRRRLSTILEQLNTDDDEEEEDIETKIDTQTASKIGTKTTTGSKIDTNTTTGPKIGTKTTTGSKIDTKTTTGPKIDTRTTTRSNISRDVVVEDASMQSNQWWRDPERNQRPGDGDKWLEPTPEAQIEFKFGAKSTAGSKIDTNTTAKSTAGSKIDTNTTAKSTAGSKIDTNTSAKSAPGSKIDTNTTAKSAPGSKIDTNTSGKSAPGSKIDTNTSTMSAPGSKTDATSTKSKAALKAASKARAKARMQPAQTQTQAQEAESKKKVVKFSDQSSTNNDAHTTPSKKKEATEAPAPRRSNRKRNTKNSYIP